MSDFVDKMSEVTEPGSSDVNNFDVVIIGGGPAGLTALHWCSELGLTVGLFEKKAELGGQLLHIYNQISNFPGVEAASGRELRDKFLPTIVGGRRFVGHEVVNADLVAMTTTDSMGTKRNARVVIIATGVRRRVLNIPGEQDFRGSGVLISGAHNRNDVAGKKVVIVGGGDAALENALILSERAERVFVVHRRNEFKARPDFVKDVSDLPNVEVLMNTRVTAICGSTKVEKVELHHVETKHRQILDADAILIRIGVVPNTELFKGQIHLDDAGYVLTGRDCSTSLPGVFAVGDVANPAAPTVAAAVGQGSIAAKAAFAWIRS